MKKFIFSLILLSSFVFAQTEIKSDPGTEEDSTKTAEDYKVQSDEDKWMSTWKEIEPSIRDFLSDEDDEDIEWKDDSGEPMKKNRKKRGYFRAAGGGWEIFNMPIDLKDINNQIGLMGLDKFDADMYFYGGGGFGFIGDHWRIGGLGAEGNMITSKTVDNIRKKVEYKMGFGGFMMERVFHPFSKTEFYLSGVVGRSHIKTIVYKRQGQEDWADAWDSFNSNNNEEDYYNYKTTFTNKYWSVLPAVGVRYNIFRVFGVGAKVGYYYGITNEDTWEINGEEISGVPKMDLSNIFYNINFYFGA
ncbi:MAG: hypothetical protein JXQ65_00625 [Candidatus Marinimicrobia bacterium]|nr:hypothetical protein [Candidatus Neomarinimicrobiota bacterium]